MNSRKNVSSYKFVPTVPVPISTQSPNNTDSDHLADNQLQFGLTAYQTGKIAVKCTLWPFPQQVPSLAIDFHAICRNLLSL